MAMISGPGISGINKASELNKSFAAAGDHLASEELKLMKSQMEIFKHSLEEFAVKYKKQIEEDPKFRTSFLQMCSDIGVDPLASTKGFWADIFGFSSFYYQLGIRIIEICLSTSPKNGGIMEVTELLSTLNSTSSLSTSMKQQSAASSTSSSNRNQKSIIAEEDIHQAISKLKCLGGDFSVITINNVSYIQSIPCTFNPDQVKLLDLAHISDDGTAFSAISINQINSVLGWDLERSNRALEFLLSQGIVWLDQTEAETFYWVPSIFYAQIEKEKENSSSSSTSSNTDTDSKPRKKRHFWKR